MPGRRGRDKLLRELFERTAEFLETGGADKADAMALIEARVETRRESARRELDALGVGRTKIESFFDSMPRRYFISHTPPQIARHAQVLLRFGDGRELTTALPGDARRLHRVHPLHPRRTRALRNRGRLSDACACGLNIAGVARLHDEVRGSRSRSIASRRAARRPRRARHAVARARGSPTGRPDRPGAGVSDWLPRETPPGGSAVRSPAPSRPSSRSRTTSPTSTRSPTSRRTTGSACSTTSRAHHRRAGLRDLHLEGRDHPRPGHGHLLPEGSRPLAGPRPGAPGRAARTALRSGARAAGARGERARRPRGPVTVPDPRGGALGGHRRLSRATRASSAGSRPTPSKPTGGTCASSPSTATAAGSRRWASFGGEHVDRLRAGARGARAGGPAVARARAWSRCAGCSAARDPGEAPGAGPARRGRGPASAGAAAPHAPSRRDRGADRVHGRRHRAGSPRSRDARGACTAPGCG